MNRAEQRAAWQARHRGTSAAPPIPAPVPGAPDIRLEIGEIVLHGLPRLNRHDVAEGLHAALTESLVTNGLPAHFTGLNRRVPSPPYPPLPSSQERGNWVSQLQGGHIAVGHGARPVAVGRQIAGAILGASLP